MNKKEIQSTGGSPCNLQPLTPLEKDIVNLLNLHVCTDPPGIDFGAKKSALKPSNSDSANKSVEN